MATSTVMPSLFRHVIITGAGISCLLGAVQILHKRLQPTFVMQGVSDLTLHAALVGQDDE